MPKDDDMLDGMMSFGDHIEELRKHLVRAIIGVGVAFFLTMPIGQYVVQALAKPVEIRLKEYFDKQTTIRSEALLEAEKALPANQRLHVELPATLSADQLQALSQSLSPGEKVKMPPGPVQITLDVPVASLIQSIVNPINDVSGRYLLRTLSVQEGFLIYFKAVLGAALVLASPWVFYQIYSFISVGLYAHERRFVNLTLPFSVGLFLVGVAICYFVMFPLMLDFFLDANSWMNLQPDIRLSEWVGFAVLLMLIFGIMFQLPLFMLMLERVGIVSYDQLSKQRKIAIFVLFIVAAIATPADPMSQVMLAIPLCLLFELGLFLMRYFEKSNPFAVEDPSLEDEEVVF